MVKNNKMEKIKPSMNVLGEENKLKYSNRIFTEEGYELLHNYIRTLAKLFIEKKDEEYPFKIGIVLGFPFFSYASIFNNKFELCGRLKAYAQILCLKDIQVKVGLKKYIIKLDGKMEKGDNNGE